MNIRRGDSGCFVRREDEQAPGPSESETAQTQKTVDSAPSQPDVANSPLPAAMLAVANDDSPQNRRTLYESLLNTWFVVPTRDTVPDKPGFSTVPANVADSLSLEHDSNAQLVAVAFTDEEALRNWNRSIAWIALQGSAFFQAVASTQAEEIVINPCEPANPNSKMIRPGGRMKRWEFEALAESRIPQLDSSAQSETPSVLVTMPKQMPATEMFKVVGEVAGTFSEIVAMYFGQVIYPDGDPHWTISVEFAGSPSAKQVNRMMTALVKAGRHVFPKSITTDLVPSSTALGQSIKTTGKKFYSVSQ